MAHLSSNQRVGLGAQYLDNTHPRWFMLVNISCLDTSSCRQDVLGQLYGNYWTGVSRLRISNPEQLGFHAISHAASNSRQTENLLLAQAWRETILERRTKKASLSESAVGRPVGNEFLEPRGSAELSSASGI